MVRRHTAAWAAAAGLDPNMVDDLVLAVHEALANVADHAYPGGVGEACLDVVRRADQVVAVVRDRGRWRTPPADPGWRGRGMVIISGLAQSVDVRHDASGTTVEMRWKVTANDTGVMGTPRRDR